MARPSTTIRPGVTLPSTRSRSSSAVRSPCLTLAPCCQPTEPARRTLLRTAKPPSPPSLTVPTAAADSIGKDESGSVFCRDCRAHQALQINLLANYDPDDPDDVRFSLRLLRFWIAELLTRG